ncbi:ATP-binding cassette domain-containing protein [Cardiobacteriaceae bacterium TAE3-ERU3]|nr:ATP-binding cassette domain-containing protein [Cardiobacteriaceae bacterium TAE3-ERU3]
MIDIQNISLAYGDGKHSNTIIDDLKTTIPVNQVVGLIGPNGCGKSTLLKGISALLKPVAGRICLDGKDVHSYSNRALAQRISVLPQNLTHPEGLTVKQLVEYGRTPYVSHWGRLGKDDHEHVHAAMSQVRIHEFAERSLEDLSGGQRQRAWIAMILAQDTDIIMLDEPTTFLDIAYQIELLKLLRTLKDGGKSIIVVLHDLNQAARYCDHLLILEQGRLHSSGCPAEVITTATLKSVFNVDAQIIPDPVAYTPMCIYL